MPVVSRDPLEAIAINDAHRRPDVPDSEEGDLRRLHAYSAAPPSDRPLGPCLMPVLAGGGEDQLRPAHDFPPIAEIRERIRALVPADEPLFPLPANVIAAGGAVSAAIGGGDAVDDLDLFVYGLDPSDEGALWAKAQEVLAHLAARYTIRSVLAVAGLLTVWAGSRSCTDRTCERCSVKIQLILRAYPSVSAILHAFDLASSAVAFDGTDVLTTALGAYAHLYRVNPVNPAYRSTSYEHRLTKYFRRGFGLALPHLKLPEWKRYAGYRLRHLAFELSEALTNGEAPWPGAWSARVVPLGGVASDYGDEEPVMGRLYARSAYRMLAGLSPAVLLEFPSADDIAEFGGFGARYPALGAAFSESDLSRFLRPEHFVLPTFKDYGCKPARRTRLATLVRRLAGIGAPDDLIGKATRIYDERAALHPGAVIDFYTPFLPWIVATREKLSALRERPLRWWIVQDPGRQYTASVNPRCEEPAEWYGADYVADPAEARAAVPPPPAAPIPPVAGEVYGGDTCGVCRGELGEVNRLVLRCGHAYHADEQPGCPGILAWFAGRGGAGDRPLCCVCATPIVALAPPRLRVPTHKPYTVPRLKADLNTGELEYCSDTDSESGTAYSSDGYSDSGDGGSDGGDGGSVGGD